jgi:manganese/zinc/iron transport system substrate-binding protein
MVTDLVRSIAGEEVTVKPLMGPGVDPHQFKPDRPHINALQSAAAIFYSGLHLEGRLTDSLENEHKQGRKVYAVADGLAADRILKSGEAPDPHIWGDADLWADGAKYTGEKLAEAFPEKAAVFRERAAAVEKELRGTHARLKAAAEALPAQQRTLITSHDAFRYFGRAYGFDVVGVQGITTVSEASLAEMARIAALVRDKGVKAIFIESSVKPDTIERLSKDTGAKIGGELYSDALGAPGTPAGTVAGMLEANMKMITDALK